MIKKLQSTIKEHIKNNRKSYLFLLMAFTLGVCAGAFTVNGLSSMQRDELLHYFQGFLQLFDNLNMNSSELFYMALLQNLKIIGLLWILGVTIIGLPFIFIILGIRGFTTGFSSGFVISALGMDGLMFSGIALLPKEILIVPCLIAIGVNGINFSMSIAKNKTRDGSNKTGLKSAFVSYCLVTLLLTCIIVAGIVFDAYITPTLLRMISMALTT
ncbi:MAG: stage II sporulation protein M [Clostridiaceae bacterium]|nr:stage II sporulation protein M [Clostridiaceae bacterium]